LCLPSLHSPGGLFPFSGTFRCLTKPPFLIFGAAAAWFALESAFCSPASPLPTPDPPFFLRTG
jgi:hypothetical protein